MIDGIDIGAIDKSYFDIIEKKDYGIVLRSRCTGHYWYLLEQEYNGCRSFQIHHKHHASGPYHLQKNKPSIKACCEYIRSHDEYHLAKIRKKEQKKQMRWQEDKTIAQGPELVARMNTAKTKKKK